MHPITGDTMYAITAVKNARFIDSMRMGISQRKSPPLHLRSGEVIRISPGETLIVSKDVVELNRRLLLENASSYIIIPNPFTAPIVPRVNPHSAPPLVPMEGPMDIVTTTPVIEEARKFKGKKKRFEEAPEETSDTSDEVEPEKMIQESLT